MQIPGLNFGGHAARGGIYAALLLALAAPLTAHANGDSRPPVPTWHTDARHCSWHWREGGGVGLWAESCKLSTGRWQVVWDAGRSAFVLQHNGAVQGVVVQSWPLPPGGGLAALTRALVDAGQLAPDAECRWTPVPLRPAPRTMAFFTLSPTAPDALAPTAQGEIPAPRCGPYGASTHGVRYFITDLRWPDRAIFVEEGQERPMFEPRSITVGR